MSSPKRILSNFEALCALRGLYPGQTYYCAVTELNDFGSDEQGVESFQLAIQPGFNRACTASVGSSWQEVFDNLAAKKLYAEANQPPSHSGDLNK